VAHITYVNISGLAGRKKDIEIKLDRNVNIFFGVNGVGKTTLLKILHSALYNEESIVDGLPFRSAEVGVYSINADREIVREIKNAPLAGEEDLFDEVLTSDGRFLVKRGRRNRNTWKARVKEGDDFDAARLSHEYLPTTRLISAADMAPSRRSSPDQSEEASINNMMEAQLKQQWLKYFTPLQSAVQGAQQRGIARILSTVLSPESGPTGPADLEPEIAYELAKRFLASHSSSKIPGNKATFIARYQKDKSLASVVNEISSIEKSVTALNRPKDELQTLLSKLFLRKNVDLSGGSIKVFVRDAGGRRLTSLKLSQLSSGEKQALYILIHALRADENSLIIDEPELSIHIDCQRQ
jgi:energy-coupling factor transporter ATP-binding protein EcfA2